MGQSIGSIIQKVMGPLMIGAGAAATATGIGAPLGAPLIATGIGATVAPGGVGNPQTWAGASHPAPPAVPPVASAPTSTGVPMIPSSTGGALTLGAAMPGSAGVSGGGGDMGTTDPYAIAMNMMQNNPFAVFQGA